MRPKIATDKAVKNYTQQEIIEVMNKYRFSFSNEAELHNAVEAILTKEGIQAESEHVLSNKDRIDFYIPESGIGIELKVKGSFVEVTRQLIRYASHSEIKGLILITNRFTHNNIPGLIGDVPISIVRLQNQL